MALDFGKLGFGFLRLPLMDPNDSNSIDIETTKKMVDLFLGKGFRYFDTAYTYLNGKSEIYLREALVERYPRDTFMIATKLPCGILKKGRSPESVFEEQLQKCGVDYFDVYLLHGLDAEDAEYAEKQGCFDFLQEQKKKGKAKYIGFSFHDKADVLDEILTRHPEIDVVQIQLNYLDWDNPIIQSEACYDVCRKHQKPIIVMEPVKGGTLATIPAEAVRLLNGEAPAHRAIRFAASQDGVALVLSGMSTIGQVAENTSFMSCFEPLTPEQTIVLKEAAQIIRRSVAISCTGCAYCEETCPVGIPVPKYFSLYNERERDGWQVDTETRYETIAAAMPRANACVECRACEKRCPQKLPVVSYLKMVSKVYD